MVICLERDADLHMAQLMPLPLVVSCFSKIQIGFTFLVPAHLGSPGKDPINWCVCVCVCVCARVCVQVNGMNVACASHEYAVQLIRESGSELMLRVLTIATPSSTSERQSTTTSCTSNGKETYCTVVV